MHFALMKNLSRWIAAYKKMDARRRSENLLIAEAAAEAHPEEPAKKVVRLELVSSNSEVGATRHEFRSPEDRRAAFVIRRSE